MRRETLEMTGTEEVKTCFRIGGGLVGGLLLSFGRRGMKSRRRRGLGQRELGGVSVMGWAWRDCGSLRENARQTWMPREKRDVRATKKLRGRVRSVSRKDIRTELLAIPYN